MSVINETRTQPSERVTPPMPAVSPSVASEKAVSELIAQGQAAIVASKQDDRNHATAQNSITHGLKFLESMEELQKQLQNIRDNKAQSIKSEPIVESEPGHDSWLGKAVGKALRSIAQPESLVEDNASIVAYEKELSLWAEYFHYSYLLREIVKTNKDWQRILCVMASKGGVSKTPLIVYLAAVFAFATSTTNLVLEGNENDGTVNKRYGLARDSQALLNDVIANLSLIADHLSTLAILGKFEQASVWALLSAANEAENTFSMPEFLAMFDKIRPHFSNIWGDTGNGNRGAANEGLFLKSDVAFFPALAGNSDSWSTIITTMINLHQAGHSAKLRERSFIVINATKEGDTLEKFLEVFREIATEAVKPRYSYETGDDNVAPLWTNDPDELLRDLGFKFDDAGKLTGEGIFMVRHSDWIDGGNIVSVRPEDVGLGTIVDYLKIAVAAFMIPTQYKETKEKEILRRIEERSDKPTLPPQASNKEHLYQQLVETFGGNPEGALLYVANQMERGKETAERPTES